MNLQLNINNLEYRSNNLNDLKQINIRKNNTFYEKIIGINDPIININNTKNNNKNYTFINKRSNMFKFNFQR